LPNAVKAIRLIKTRWAGHVTGVKEKRKEGRVLVGEPEGKRQLGRTRQRNEDNIKMDIRERGWDDTDWIYVA
jgi:hypothetical protein